MKTKTRNPRRVSKPVFLYFSACCGVNGVKPPCVKVAPKDRETNSLGSWRCGKCGKPCKVNRHVNKTETGPETAPDTPETASEKSLDTQADIR